MQQHLRLRRTEDFQRLRRVGVTQPHRLMVLSFAHNELMHNRYGFIVSKQLGKAVTRNRVKRMLREVIALSQHITATVESRLAGAGILCIPHSATMPNPKQSESDGVEPLHPDPFVDGLMQAMITPIQDRDDASAVVPVIVKVPDEAVGKIQHLSFATELDSKVSELRESALRRFAGGSDLPYPMDSMVAGATQPLAVSASAPVESGELEVRAAVAVDYGWGD